MKTSKKGKYKKKKPTCCKQRKRGADQQTRKKNQRRKHSQTEECRGRDLSGHARKPTDRGTHVLETAEGGACQDMQGNRPTEVHSRSGDNRGRNLSGHARKPTDRGALTNWRRQREALVRTRKETDQPRHTHVLETAEGGTCQDT